MRLVSGLGCFFLLIFSFGISSVYCLSSNGKTLLSLVSNWSLPPSLQWNASDSFPCTWVGVECDLHTHRVISLNLSNFGISGQLGPQIAHLTYLNSLDLSLNNFSGPIPPNLANCTSLYYLDLSLNGFSGYVPDNLKMLQNLRFLNFHGNSLSGSIPNSLFLIPHLQSIYLSENKLSGSTPENVGNLSEVVSLWLYGNQLSGTIPSSIANCSNLQELYLNDNQFVGFLPENLNNLENLVYLDVSSNSMKGTIPMSLGKCKYLNTLVLSFNSFSGKIPAALGNCSSLTAFAALSNMLTGRIPSFFGLLNKLSILYLSENRLSGTIPPELGNCKSLQSLELYDNQLEGTIPSELGSLSNLQDLFLFINHLTGVVPKSIWKIPSLENFLVYNNNLSGELPLEMTKLIQLKNVSLYNNYFSGIIPQDLGINSSLVQLDFTNNNFSGTIPPNLCFRKQLKVLNMGLNNLGGGIPSDVCNCSSLKRLRLQKNNLTGVLPEFVNNPNLLFMDISENNIHGAIPSSLGNCRNLTSIDLSSNKLTGVIPQEIGKLSNLQLLNLSHNNLEGPLPSQLANCTNLFEMDVGFNSLNGSLPSSLRSLAGLSVLILRENRFSGGIPPFLSVFDKLSELQLGGNLFGGNIPSDIGGLQNLIYALNLSGNGLIGELPLWMGKLIRLQILDISQNNLTGTLTVLNGIHSLIEVNISDNNFSGPVPESLMSFLSSTPSSFYGNPGLCIICHPPGNSSCITNRIFKACDPPPVSGKGLSKLQIAMIALGSTIFCVFVVLGLGFVFLQWKRPKQEVEISSRRGSSALLKKLMEATENLNHRFIIGRGAHGTVYKATLGEERVFAIKKLSLAGQKARSKSMVREIQTLGKIRHRNLVKLQDFWLRRDHGILSYTYMQNGSLHDVLHEVRPPPTLTWNIRYKIALGTAQGLAYLHYDCDPPIIHRDIKPKNILLDSDMEPHISDFGIAKILDQSSASSPSITIAGTTGYIAPENAFTTARGKESDVYSYGVVLLELITRRQALDSSFGEETEIVGWARSVWRNSQNIKRIVDPSLEELLDTSIMEQVVSVFLVALRCTEKETNLRPTMRDVVKQLMDANSPHRSRCTGSK